MSAQSETPLTDELMARLPSTMDSSGDADAIRKVVDLCRYLERQLSAQGAPAAGSPIPALNNALFVEQWDRLTEILGIEKCSVIETVDEVEKRLAAPPAQHEPVSNSYKLGQCIKCGNPLDQESKKHLVVATASEGGLSPEVLTPQRVEAPPAPSAKGWAIKGPDGDILFSTFCKSEEACWWGFVSKTSQTDVAIRKLKEKCYTCVPVTITERSGG